MTDQDHDGSHIKGLLVNLFDHFWPSLLRLPGFLAQFRTPIVKVSRSGHPTVPFYALHDLAAWQRTHNGGHGWTVKYYKVPVSPRPFPRQSHPMIYCLCRTP